LPNEKRVIWNSWLHFDFLLSANFSGEAILDADDGVELCDRDLVVGEMIYVGRFNVLQDTLRSISSRKFALLVSYATRFDCTVCAPAAKFCPL